MVIKIPLLARSKKNSQRIIYNKYTNKPMIIQSELYKQFENECALFLNRYREKIDYPINIKCTFFVNDKKRRDLTNLENAIADILVKYEVIKDDNYNIISGWDGSRIIYRKDKEPEIIIEITSMEETENDKKDKKNT